MSALTTTDLAAALSLSKGRISQYVSEKKLDGCFEGEGRARRFDLDKVKQALGRSLDPGQMLGNGLKTRRVLREKATDGEPEAGADTQAAQDARRDGPLAKGDNDATELANLAIKQENLRTLRRNNAVAEGQYVLAAEVERQVAQIIAQEVAEFEQVLRDGARAIADKLGIDFKVARKILTDMWRAHRKGRVVVLDQQAQDANLADAERVADI